MFFCHSTNAFFLHCLNCILQITSATRLGFRVLKLTPLPRSTNSGFLLGHILHGLLSSALTRFPVNLFRDLLEARKTFANAKLDIALVVEKACYITTFFLHVQRSCAHFEHSLPDLIGSHRRVRPGKAPVAAPLSKWRHDGFW